MVAPVGVFAQTAIVIKRVTPIHILIVVVAFIIGAFVDHAFLAEPSPKQNGSDVSRAPVPAARNDDVTQMAANAEQTSADSRAASKKSLDSILAEHDRRKRTSDLEAFISGLQPADFADALKRIRRMSGSNDRDLASRLLVSRWVQSDPDAALQFAASNHGYEYVAEDVFEQAAATDLQSALERAKSLPNSDLRYMALRGVLSFIADTNPAGALQLSQTFGDFSGNEPLSNVIYRQWAANDPQAAAAQASQSNVDGWRSPVGQVVRTWAGQDPVAAANWSLSLSDPSEQSRSISQVMRQWSRTDPTAAANWINALPAGSSHDAAVAALAYSIASTDPQYAVSWAQNIADETARNNALQRVGLAVMRRDPTNGAAILQAAGVPQNLIPAPGTRGPRGPGP